MFRTRSPRRTHFREALWSTADMAVLASLVAVLLFVVGIGGLVVWSVALAGGRYPIAGPLDALNPAVIFAFRLGSVWLGWRQSRPSKKELPAELLH